jgi:RNA-splicing ligase RtcB
VIEIKGAFNTAVAYTDRLEEKAEAQIRALCDQPHFEGLKIRVMPDVHAGKGCTIGTTMTLKDRVVPNMVGVDIGCGMETVLLKEKEIDFTILDRAVHRYIPCGREIRRQEHPFAALIELEALRCAGKAQLIRARHSISTLGGGNHFIEVDRDEEGNLYLIVHSGSRHLGTEVAEWYQEEGFRALCGASESQLKETIAALKRAGKSKEIQSRIHALKASAESPVPRDLAYVSGALFDDYIHDMRLTQRFAALNRKAMVEVILKEANLTASDSFTTIHNYIDTESMIMRKGAVSARLGERLLIPINMRDGSLLCVGKGNDDWNQSAPHGAGRLLSRSEASRTLSVQQFKEAMQGVYSTTVSKATLDEAPMAYKAMDDIVENIGPTAEITKVLKPVYNFKAAE